ncbi:MAG: hypothetical protein CVU52_08770 [Deltaproteobacteria bacterium HGW-Deltaproteobacteria-10]|nr:MAG: hypothetical protein CVU52_08770 [Deltaproteobacteria bacterium HGW-Deltaproteobacteria-10]
MKLRYKLLFFAGLLGICIFLFISFYNQAKQEAFNNIHNEQLLHARQAARGIEDFFNNWTLILKTLAEADSVIKMDKVGQEDVKLLFRTNQDRIKSITRVDATGKIIYTIPFNRDAIGRNISEQKHIREIMNTHKPVVSDVFFAVQGYDTVALHVPVFKNNIYQGSIGIAINFQALAKRYLEEIKIGETGYAWMISRDGTELYCPVPGHTGKSVMENCKDFPSILTMAGEMLKGHAGSTTYSFDKIRGEEVEVIKKYAVYSPINIGNTFWSIVVASTEDEIIASLEGFRNKLVILIAFLLLCGFLFAYFGLKAWFIIGEGEKRRLAEEALRESEEKFRTITENMMDCVSLVDMNIVYQYVTPSSYRKTLGYEPEEMIGLSGFSITHPDDLERVQKLYQENIALGVSEGRYETRLRHKDGHYVSMETMIRVLKDTEGKALGAVITARDITKRLQAEAQRRKAEENYRSIVENAVEGIFQTTMDGNFLTVNPALANILGYESPADLMVAVTSIGTQLYVKPEAREEYLRLIKEKGAVNAFEAQMRRKDGGICWTSMNTRVIRSADGSPSHLEGFLTDITERKQAEEKIKDAEETYRNIFMNAQIGLFRTDMATGILVEANDKLAQVIGFKNREELLLSKFNIADRYIDPVARKKMIALIREHGQINNYETQFRINSGEIRWVRFYAKLVPEKGWLEGVSEDITDIKQAAEEKRLLEERLQQADKMESIGILAGGIAHDFNNLLMGIQGYASLILRHLSQDDPAYEMVLRIEEQVQGGADLTRQLLGFARGGRYEVRPTDMNEILEKTSSLFGRTKKEISLHRQSGKDLWSVEVDRGQMEQVFLNLYVNAWQAMPGGGNLYLACENAFLNAEQALLYSVQPGKYVKITITDTGIGMDEKTRERIFEPFFTTKKMGRGTGLGLATVYGVIKGHQGMISVESEPGQGTTFTIYLPASDKAVLRKKPANEKIVMGTETILLVDDEKMVMDVNRELLEAMGYKVYGAGSGQEAVAVYMEKKDKIDLIILDMIMPGMQGSEVFDRLRQINPQVRILLSSGYSLNGEAQAIINRGCNGFIQKPFRLQELAGKVREVLS